MNKKLLSIITSFGLFVAYLSLSSTSTGITGLSTSGCSCHGVASTNTIISVTGFPSNYVNGQAYSITLTVTNTSMSEAGFDLSVTGGVLSNAPAGTALNGTTELRHTTPQSLIGGSTSWTFTWTAPATGVSSKTLNVAGNAVNGNGFTSGDAFNLFSATASGPAATVSATAVSSNVTCFGASNGIIGAFGSGGFSPYTFSLNGGPYQSGAAFNGLAPGVYTLTAKDASNNTGTIVKTITQPTPIIVTINTTNILCFGSTGTITAVPTGGTGAYTYSWTPGGSILASITNANAGTYTCTITDANGCTASSSAILTQPSTGITASISSVSPIVCFGGNTGSATVVGTGGAGLLSYVWNGGIGVGATANNLVAGTYTCTISDANNCTKSITVTITQPSASFNATASTISNISCFGLNNGNALCNATGSGSPFTYLWSPGGSTIASPLSLGAGTYTCTVTNSSGCTVSATTIVTEPTALVVTSSSNNKVSCKNDSDGFINVFVSGGIPAYLYSWNSGGITSSIANLPPGTYTCSISDANGCQKTTTTTIAQSMDTANANYTQTGNTLLAIQNNANYQWITCNPISNINNAIQQNFTILKGNSYGLIVTSGTCKDTSNCKTINPLSISTTINKIENKFYNGAMHTFIYENNETKSKVYKIVNSQGTLMQQGKFNIGNNTIATAGLANGIYFLFTDNEKYKIMIGN